MENRSLAGSLPAAQPVAQAPLRLFDAAEPPDPCGPVPVDVPPDWPLDVFTREWFLPVALGVSYQQVVKDSSLYPTAVTYLDTAAWWRTLTLNPPISAISITDVRAFEGSLAGASWKRGLRGPARLLSPATRAKHMRQLRTILRRLGPDLDWERIGARIHTTTPRFRVTSHRLLPKASFTVAEATALVAATGRLSRPRSVKRGDERRGKWLVPWRDWWRAFLLTLFYTGLRTGTVLELTREMFEQRGDDTWLRIPGEIRTADGLVIKVVKTKNALLKFLHPVAAAAISNLGVQEGRVFHWPHCPRHLLTVHERVQRIAGLDQVLSPHAWRRTHAKQIALLGGRAALATAQRALDHADARTTGESYCNIEPELIRQFPLIALPEDAPLPPTNSDPQRLLF